MARRAARLAVVALAAAACSLQSSAATPSPSSPLPRGALLAVLEPGSFSQVAYAHESVALIGASGRAVARQTFAARSVPRVALAAPVMAPEAQVAAGRVWFVDGGGSVRSLDAAGKVVEVTRFPLDSPQKMLSFAVSGDGGRLMAAEFTWSPPATGPGAADQPLAYDVYSAAPAAAAVLVAHHEWSQGPTPQLAQPVLQLVGWAKAAPLAVVDTALPGTQETLPEPFSGPLVEVAATGSPGVEIGGSDCNAVSVLPDETVLCYDPASGSASVRSKAGRRLFELTGTPLANVEGTALAPDGRHAALGSVVLGQDGHRLQLPPAFQPEGWVDAATVVGVQFTDQGESNLELIRLSQPGNVVDAGVKGTYVGTLTA
ncbi:MAG: hypothetical protein M3024_08635 [Candidatus Dormibacteraeota bacterium]|nr:hypothetical protein [Candidatus Dormibacteraeota bacterium]